MAKKKKTERPDWHTCLTVGECYPLPRSDLKKFWRSARDLSSRFNLMAPADVAGRQWISDTKMAVMAPTDKILGQWIEWNKKHAKTLSENERLALVDQRTVAKTLPDILNRAKRADVYSAGYVATRPGDPYAVIKDSVALLVNTEGQHKQTYAWQLALLVKLWPKAVICFGKDDIIQFRQDGEIVALLMGFSST